VDKALWIAGLGQDNLVKIPTGEGPLYPMQVDALDATIAADRAAGHLPAGVVVCVGGTSTGATDNARDVIALAKREGLYTHVDAAWAGSAMICPEFRPLWDGVAEADSLVLNPHKWLGSGMECSAHFVRDPESLVRTLAIQPEYLKTRGADGVVNFSEWSVQLGRRFRALKVWFLIRAYGIEGLQAMIRNHVNWAVALCERLRAEPDIEIVTEPVLSLFSFRHCPTGMDDLDAHNLALLERINNDGRIYLTQTNHDGVIAIRFQAGQFDTTEADFDIAFTAIRELAMT
jgi:aromatic-L-amino-acid decarboxylase